MLTLLIVCLLVLALAGAIPWSQGSYYGRGVSGLVAVVLLVLLVLFLTGNLGAVGPVRLPR